MKKYISWSLVFLVIVFAYFSLSKHKTEVVVSLNVPVKNSSQVNQDNSVHPASRPYKDAKCIENQNFFVVSQEFLVNNGDGGNSVAENILVKYKKDSNQTIACTYTVDKNDFEITNEYPQFVIALENNFLIVDNGTGPDSRPFLIYDLNTRKMVLEDSYISTVVTKNNRLEYWTPEDKLVAIEKCPQPAGGLSAGVDSYVQLDLSTLKKRV